MKRNRTIQDFGNQWRIHGSLEDDYWTSDLLFRDHFENQILPFESLSEKTVVDVGSGSGRILKMIARYQPKKLYGVEPSQGFDILQKNVSDIYGVELINSSAEDFELPQKADIAFSFGVIHHIPEPERAIRNIYLQLNDAGVFLMWVYGYENNEIYVRIQDLIRRLTRRVPDVFLDGIALVCTYLVDLYLSFSTRIFKSKLPLTSYLEKLFSKCGRLQKKYIIFDQLNPFYAKYYKKEEVVSLLEAAGFSDVSLFHRHLYSWTAIAKK